MADITRGPGEQVWINGRRCDPEYVDELVVTERERCARIAETCPDSDVDTRESIARQIRSGE